MRKSTVVALGLTGRTRFRTRNRFFVGPTILVLQVEEEIADQDGDGISGNITRAWRDALVEDLAELDLPATGAR